MPSCLMRKCTNYDSKTNQTPWNHIPQFIDEMEVDVKVFSSKITRTSQSEKNNLYDLLKIVPAAPTILKDTNKNGCEFQPKNDKYYEPKKKNKLKVKTIRDIRNEYEKDVYSYLPNDLEKQQIILLKKIIDGSSRTENTQKLASTMLKGDNPISRSAWQMLMNINPNNKIHPIQYVVWNNKRIRVCGSKGGENKFISLIDLGKRKEELKYRRALKRAKKGLLQNSLSVKFKPGPLQLKKYLDDSYQKYHVGNIELVDLPKPALEIQTFYGCSLDPTITNFLNSLRDVDGTISQKWAEFAVSAVGNVSASNEVQIVQESNVTFDLCFKYGQSRILMRRDIDRAINLNSHNPAITERLLARHETDVILEVKNIICDMIDCVEISLQQDNMYSGEDDERCMATDIDLNVASNNLIKEKPKKKYSELDRLHVTVIRLAENDESRNTKLNACKNTYCSLGCVCFSLECPLNLRRHCGRIDCMFECKCNFSKYKALDSFDAECPDILPDLYNLDNAANSKLAKEEQKFHQTVIMTGEKSILLKSQRRNWKASKKYSDFYKNMPLRPELKETRILSVVDRKLNCENIEPWCMAHNLYKCFCKGKFVDSVIPALVTYDSNINIAAEPKEKKIVDSDIKSSAVNKTIKLPELVNKTMEFQSNVNIESNSISNDVNKLLKLSEQSEIPPNCHFRKQPERQSYRTRLMSKRQSNNSESDSNHSCEYYNTYECARVKPYDGRKFSNGYYNNTNLKIWELEKNDCKLRKRLATLTRNIDVEDNLDITSNTNNKTSMNMSNEINTNVAESTESKSNVDEGDYIFSKSKIRDTRLKTWLENAFKQYKKSCSKGGITALQAPQANKLALYPWDFILSRYRERKNHFLVSKLIPFRMFMAVDTKHPFFQECINIDNIRFTDLYKYPVTVKNLLTNATDLKDSFCILSGLPYCWELKGSVTKVIEENSDNTSNNEITESPQTEITQTSECSDHNISSETEIEAKNIVETPLGSNISNSDISKWFVMTVEDDFVEIQLARRGFFVTYRSILNAIRIARVSGKTARLSGQKNVDKDSCTPFGVYAIPNIHEDCVFIGPYEGDETLGIETVRSRSLIMKPNRTRGFWITTNKVDNMKVIDNPMSFVSPAGSEKNNLVSLDSNSKDLKENIDNNNVIVDHMPFVHSTGSENNNLISLDSNSSDLNEMLVSSEVSNAMKNDANHKAKLKPKIVKPIKIRKSDNMFRVTAELNPIALQAIGVNSQSNISLVSNTNNLSSTSPTPGAATDIPSEENVFLITPTEKTSIGNEENVFLIPPTEKGLQIKISSVVSMSTEENVFLIPPTEEGPQIKISSVYSEADNTLGERNKDPKLGSNMFVLKPEEINKRLSGILKDKSFYENDDHKNGGDKVQIKMNETEINTDIENFLATTVISSGLSSDVFIISDDDEETDKSTCTNVWIECTNIDNFGWIRGKRNVDSRLSFEFPGFQYTEFYPEDIAFYKINQVLSRKICVPKNITIKWKVTETMNELKSSYQLKCEHLGSDLILTSRGIRQKSDLLKGLVRNCKTYSRAPRNATCNSPSEKSPDKMDNT